MCVLWFRKKGGRRKCKVSFRVHVGVLDRVLCDTSPSVLRHGDLNFKVNCCLTLVLGECEDLLTPDSKVTTDQSKVTYRSKGDQEQGLKCSCISESPPKSMG